MALAGYGNRVEGIHAVAAAARAGRITHIWVEERRRGSEEVRDILRHIEPVLVTMVDDVRPLAETTAPQGLVAECRPIRPVQLDEIMGDRAAVLVLDRIVDPHNVGAIARSAVAAGITGMVVSERRSAPLSATAFKAAAGALESLPVAIVGSVAEAASRLKSLGLWLVGLDADGSQSLFGMELFTEPVAVIVGSEGRGLSALVAKRCDVLASIPMTGGMESVNASVSAALASFEIMRVRNEAPDT